MPKRAANGRPFRLGTFLRLCGILPGANDFPGVLGNSDFIESTALERFNPMEMQT
jgi:hypothetical protein